MLINTMLTVDSLQSEGKLVSNSPRYDQQQDDDQLFYLLLGIACEEEKQEGDRNLTYDEECI